MFDVRGGGAISPDVVQGARIRREDLPAALWLAGYDFILQGAVRRTEGVPVVASPWTLGLYRQAHPCRWGACESSSGGAGREYQNQESGPPSRERAYHGFPLPVVLQGRSHSLVSVLSTQARWPRRTGPRRAYAVCESAGACILDKVSPWPEKLAECESRRSAIRETELPDMPGTVSANGVPGSRSTAHGDRS